MLEQPQSKSSINWYVMIPLLIVVGCLIVFIFTRPEQPPKAAPPAPVEQPAQGSDSLPPAVAGAPILGVDQNPDAKPATPPAEPVQQEPPPKTGS